MRSPSAGRVERKHGEGAVRKTEKGAALRRWVKEEWRTLSGDKDYSKGDRSFRPTKRISSKTPATASELTPAEKARGSKEKREKKLLKIRNKTQVVMEVNQKKKRKNKIL